MKKFLLTIICGLTLASLSGCAALLIGAGVAGGVAISEDTAKLEADTDYGRAWNVTYDVIKGMGVITSEDKDTGKIEAKVQDSNIEAKVIPLTSRTVQIQIKSRKNLLPNMDLAMKIINRINSKL